MRLADRANVVDMGLDPDEIVSFAGGWVGHRAPEGLRLEYRAVADDPELFHELGAYSPTPGLPRLREALVRADRALYRTPGLTVDHVLVGPSSTALTYALLVALLDPGDAAVLFDPTYANYPTQLALCQEELRVRRLRVMNTDAWSAFADPDTLLAAFAEILERDRPRLLLFSSPDNPTGRIVPDAIFNELVARAAAADCWVAVDQAYRAQCYVDPLPASLSAGPAEHPNLIRIHSNSKWCRGLGRRLGWVEATPELVQALEVAQQGVALCPDTVHQHALAAYLERGLDDGSLARYLEDARGSYRTAAEHLCRGIDEHLGMRYLTPQGGLYTVMDVGTDGDQFAYDVLRHTGVVFVPGSGFGPSLRDAVRISFGPLVNDLGRMEEAIARVGRYLDR
jgi:aspartate/methionine/tyrosine aminotransferase